MKTRRLNDTDFARLTVQSEDAQWRHLVKMTSSFAPYSLSPVRRAFGDIFNLELPLFARLEQAHAEISTILDAVGKRCKPGTEKEQNEEVAILLHAFSTRDVEISRPLPYTSLKLGESRAFWQPRYLVIGGKPILFEIDPRGAVNLGTEARRVVFSGMDVGIRQIDSDFEDARLLIIQLPRIKGRRHIKLHWGDDVDLFSYAELQAKSAVTEGLWLSAQAEQERRKRSGASDRTGTLL